MPTFFTPYVKSRRHRFGIKERERKAEASTAYIAWLAAHLGGAIAGFYFIRNQHLLRGFLDVGLGPGKPKARAGRPRSPKRSRKTEQVELDRILAKVAAKGLHSLTQKEKKTLERASREARDSA